VTRAAKAAPELVVEVVYALPELCHRLRVPVPADATVGEVLRHVARLERPEPCWQEAFLDAALQEGRVGIYGEPVGADRRLTEADRLELYRPLPADPKIVRRERARRQQRRR